MLFRSLVGVDGGVCILLEILYFSESLGRDNSRYRDITLKIRRVHAIASEIGIIQRSVEYDRLFHDVAVERSSDRILSFGYTVVVEFYYGGNRFYRLFD